MYDYDDMNDTNLRWSEKSCQVPRPRAAISYVEQARAWEYFTIKLKHKNNIVPTGWVKKKWDLKKFQIALTHSILKLKSIVIPLNQMSQSGEKHAQD